MPTSGAPRNSGEPIADADIIALICEQARAWNCAEAVAVARCESHLDFNAISADGQNVGGFQINLVHVGKAGGDAAQLLIPSVNVGVAYAIWLDQGWLPWACRSAIR